MPLDFNSNVDFVDQNIRYMDDLYALDSNHFDAWRDWTQANLSTKLDSYTLPTGKVIMLGTWNGDVYSVFKNKYGSENCKGFDIVAYYEDTTTTIGDFRDIHEDHAMDAALIYNAMGTWEHNGLSKEAGLTYSVANLVTGGYYIEQATPVAVSRISTTEATGLTHIGYFTDAADNNRLIIFQK